MTAETRVPPGGALLKVLNMVVRGEATSRADIARRSGLARSTVSQQVDFLLERRILDEVEAGQSAGGRPPRLLSISPHAGTIAVADVDTMATQVAIADLNRQILARGVVDVPVDQGPDVLLSAVTERIRDLLDAQDRDPGRVRQVVAGLPAPVDFHQGCAVRPPIMPGWDRYPVGSSLRAKLGAPVTVDNDVNLMALGEASREVVDIPLLFIKVGAGIGAGIVTADGNVHRGADGAAGDIGHIRTSTRRGVVCRCGKLDCLEAVASYRAVLNDLDISVDSDEDHIHASALLGRRVANSDAATVRRLREAAADLGEVVAMLIHTLNPRTLVLGGPLSEVQDEILSGVRAAVYERALPLATRKLTITTTQLGSDAGIVGAVALSSREIFSPAGLTRLLAD